MRSSTPVLHFLLGVLMCVCLLSLPLASDSSTAADTSTATPPEPYATSRSVAYHVLATPAYILHAATCPAELTFGFILTTAVVVPMAWIAVL